MRFPYTVQTTGGRKSFSTDLFEENAKLRVQLLQAQQDVKILQAGLVFCQGPETVAKREKFRFIRAYTGRWPVAAMCQVLRVSQQGYYCFLRACLREEPENGNYGVRRIIWWLRLHRGYTGGDRCIYRICREHNLMIRPKCRSNGITKEDRSAEKFGNLIKQDFSAEKPNEKFLTDITEVACSDGKLYPAAVLECFDGSVQGFRMASYMRAGLCVDAFENACRKSGARGMILHSDRSSGGLALRKILCKRYSTNVKNGAVFCALAGLNSLGPRSPGLALQYARPQGVNAARA